jgi:hypothetical protein
MLPKERAVAKKKPLTPIIIGVVVLLLFIGIVYKMSTRPQSAKPYTTPVASAVVPAASAPVATTITASEPPAATASAPVPASTVAASAPLPKDRATAEEELDRLNDEYARLKAQKADLSKQLEVQNKIIALKDQQIKQLESSAP